MNNEVEIVVSSRDKSEAGESSVRRRFSALKGHLGREGKAAGEAFSDNLSTGLKKLQIALDKSETSARELRAEFEKTGNMELLPKIDKADRSVKQLSRRVKQFADDAKDAGEEAGDGLAQGVEKRGGGRLKGLFAKIGPGLAAGAAAVGASAGALLMQGLQGAMERESANAKLFASLNLEPGEAKKLGKISGEVFAGAYADSMQAATEAVGAVRSSISGLATDASLKQATINASNFASVFGVEVSRAAAVAGVAIKSGLAKDATQAFDLMTAAAQKVPKALVEPVLDAAEEYSQFFNQLGFSGPEAFDLLARGAAKGQFGIDKAGDAIKEFTIRATDGSKLTVDAYKAMGLSSDKMSNDVLAGGERASSAFGSIIEGLLKIKDPTKQANAAIALFGTPLEDLSTGEIPAFLQSMHNLGNGLGDVEGRMKTVGETLDTNAAKWQSWKNKASLAVSDFGAKAITALSSPEFADIGKKLMATLKDVGPDAKKAFADISAAVKDAKPAIMDFLDIMGPVLKATFKGLAFTITGTITLFRGFVGMLKLALNGGLTFAIGFLSAIGKVAGVMAKFPGASQGMWRSIRDGAASAVRSLNGVRDAVNGIPSYKPVRIHVQTHHSVTGAPRRGTIPEGFAHGGIVGAVQGAANGGIRNGLTMVGEYGRELVELPPGSRVHPNGTTERMMAGGGGGPMQIIVSARPGASRDLMDAMLQWLRFEVRTSGSGSAQTLLGTG